MLLLQDARDLVVDRLRLPRVAARRDHEEVGEVADTTHVEDGDVGRQLLLAESGGTACLLEWCQVGLSRVLVGIRLSLLRRRIQAEARDLRPRPSRERDRRSARRVRHASRISDDETGDGLHVELDDAIRSRARRCAHRLDLVAGDARPHRDGESHELEHALAATSRLSKSASSSAPEHEVRRPPDDALLERVDRASVRGRARRQPRGRPANASRVELEPRLRPGSSRACGPGRRRRGRGARSSPKLANCGASERDVAVVRRIEDPAEDPGHCHSSSSSPTSTCAPRLIPRPRSAASSSSGGGGVPTTR